MKQLAVLAVMALVLALPAQGQMQQMNLFTMLDSPDPHEREFAVSALKEAVKNSYPQFPGGRKALIAFITTHFKYPVRAWENGIEGVVKVQFTIQKDGIPTDPVVVKSLTGIPEASLIRLVEEMPRWHPATQNGLPVQVKYLLPIQLRLE